MDPSSAGLQVAIIEHDFNGDDLIVWKFPSLPESLYDIIIKRASNEAKVQPFIFLKIRGDWIYILRMSISKDVNPNVLNASICLVSRTFDPERFMALGQILFQQYSQACDPTKVLEGCLSVVTTGKYSNSAGTYDVAAFAGTDPCLAVSSIKEIISMLGTEVVILWNAIMLKKRILVTSDKIDKLLPVIRTLPQMAWHRKDWSILRPIVSTDAEHIEDLASSGVYIAGTLDSTLTSRSDLFDVVFSLEEGRVTIMSHAMAQLKMGSIHREVATLLTETAAAGGSFQDILRELAKKTASIITQLKSLAVNGKITEESLREKVSNENTQHWLYRLASAENLV